MDEWNNFNGFNTFWMEATMDPMGIPKGVGYRDRNIGWGLVNKLETYVLNYNRNKKKEKQDIIMSDKSRNKKKEDCVIIDKSKNNYITKDEKRRRMIRRKHRTRKRHYKDISESEDASVSDGLEGILFRDDSKDVSFSDSEDISYSDCEKVCKFTFSKQFLL